METNFQAAPPPNQAPIANDSNPPQLPPQLNEPSANGGTATPWYQQTINSLLDRLAPLAPAPAPQPGGAGDSLTSQTHQSSNISASSQGENNQSHGEIDAAIDDDGFPTNDEYLIQQGLTPSALNRELVTLQEQYDQFLEILMNPATRQQALAEFDRQLAQQGGRAQFPTAPGQPLPPGQDYSQAMQALQSGYNPPDGSLYQAVSQLPPDLLVNGLLQTLSDYGPAGF